MDAFFASVEQRDRPELRGQPVLIGHDGPRGVVAAASYESRTFGCRSAQPMAVALRLCPQAIVVAPRGARYREASQQVFEVFERVTPLVEPLSIDEAFLDVTGSVRLLGTPRQIAEQIKTDIVAATGLTASVGVAHNKFLAKLCSDWNKPDGLYELAAADVLATLAPLPIRAMWGVGPAAERRLVELGITTFADLHGLSLEQAAARIGSGGERLWHLARGQDDRPVVPDHEAKSIGHEQTFETDVPDVEVVRSVLWGQADRVAERLRRAGLHCRTVTLKIRYGDFETITRSKTLPTSTDRTDVVQRAASGLLSSWASRSFRPVRLIGVSVTQFSGTPARQGSLFGDEEGERQRRVDAATDAIRRRYGRDAVRRGGSTP